MSELNDELLVELARTTAVLLAQRALERGRASINERDYLQPSCVAAARALAAQRDDVELAATVRLRSEIWPRLGGIDVALIRHSQPQPILVELKAGTGRDGLIACAWDALKLAFALQLSQTSDAYLLAAAPADDWSSARGSEFFTDCWFESDALRDPFADGWRTWERDGYPAGQQVPAAFRTRAICAVPFHVALTRWEIRVAAVHVDDPWTWIEWSPLLGYALDSRENVTDAERPT